MNSIGLIEFSSMADGIAYTHLALKNANVELYKQELMCPGKYVLMLKGTTQSLKFAEDLLTQFATVIHATFLFKLHPSVMETINRPIQHKQGVNYIIVETRHYIESIKLCDDFVKHANVKIERIVDRLGLFGKGLIICSGSSSQLQLAKDIVEDTDPNRVVSVAILEAVQEEIFKF